MATAGQRKNRGGSKRYHTRTTTPAVCTGSRDNSLDDLSSKLDEVRLSQRQESTTHRTGCTTRLVPVRSARGIKRRRGTPNWPKALEDDQTSGRGRRRGRGRGNSRPIARDETRKEHGTCILKCPQVNATNSRPCDELPTLDSWDGPPLTYHYEAQGSGSDTYSTFDSVRPDRHEPTNELDGEGSLRDLSSNVASGCNSTLSDSDDHDGFIEPLSEDYHCPICLSVLQDANLTSCCGNHFCKECIERVKDSHKPCPLCKEHSYEIMCDKFFIRKLNDHKVQCPKRAQGCKWVGRLGDQQEHVRRCNHQFMYGEITGALPCTNKRGAARVQRRKLETQLNGRCQQPRWSTHASPRPRPRDRHVLNESWITHTSPRQIPSDRDVLNESQITLTHSQQNPREHDDFDRELHLSYRPSSYAREYPYEPVSNSRRINDSGLYRSEIVKLLLDIVAQNPDIRISCVTGSEAVAGATGAVASGGVVGGRLGYVAGFRGMFYGALLGAAVGGCVFAHAVLGSDQAAINALNRMKHADPKALAATALSVAQELGLCIHYEHGRAVLKSTSWSTCERQFLIAVLGKLGYIVLNVA